MEMRFKDFSYVRNVCFSQVPKIPSLPCDKKEKEERIDENESTNAEYISDLRENHHR